MKFLNIIGLAAATMASAVLAGPLIEPVQQHVLSTNNAPADFRKMYNL